MSWVFSGQFEKIVVKLMKGSDHLRDANSVQERDICPIHKVHELFPWFVKEPNRSERIHGLLEDIIVPIASKSRPLQFSIHACIHYGDFKMQANPHGSPADTRGRTLERTINLKV